MSFAEKCEMFGFKEAAESLKKEPEYVEMVSVETNEDGEPVFNFGRQRVVPTTTAIDGHYWLETDGVINDQTRALAVISQSPVWKGMLREDPNTFFCFEYLKDAAMEQRILTEELAKEQENWGGVEQWEQKILAICGNREEGGAVGAFDCFQNTSYEWLKGGKKGVRRFGLVGIASPKRQEIHWIFGHPDNKTYDDWLVKNGHTNKNIKHERRTRFQEHPRIVAELAKQVKAEMERKAAEKAAEDKRKAEEAERRAIEMVELEKVAQKAMDALLADLDAEDSKKANKKSKGKGKEWGGCEIDRKKANKKSNTKGK
jgi:hypothetical protein